MTIYTAGTLINDEFEVIQGPREKPSLAGGMGLVYICCRLKTGMPFAVKTLRDEYFQEKSIRERFIQEATTWINLETHRNIVQAHFVEKIKGKPHIFLEYIPGYQGYDSSLRSWLRRGPLDMETALDFAIQICLGMHYAQKKVPGLVHRDLKPENILVAPDKTVKITDFGLVKILPGETITDTQPKDKELSTQHTTFLTQVGLVLGTLPYMSPEQCSGEKIDIYSDIYSFGCVLFEILTGRWIFQEQTKQGFIKRHLSEAPRPPSSLIQSIPQEIDKVVLRCLNKSPDERYEGFGDLLVTLTKTFQEIIGKPPTLEFKATRLEASDLFLKGTSLLHLDKPDEALKYLDQVLEIDPMNANFWATQGFALDKLGRYEDAIGCCDQALTIDVDCELAWFYKGNSLSSLEKYDEAVVCYDRSLELDPKSIVTLSNKANLLDTLGKKQDAIILYEKALQMDPTCDDAVEPWYNKGVLLVDLDRLEEALSCFENALKINPTRVDAWSNKGVILHKLGKTQEAIECQNRALEYAPQHTSALINKATVLRQLERFEEAIVCYDNILQFDRNSALAWKEKGDVFLQMSRIEDATNCFNRALQIDPNNPEAWARKGAVYFSWGDLKNALICTNNALRIDPDHPEALGVSKLVQKRQLVREIVELGRHGRFTIPDKVFRELDEIFFKMLELEAAYLRDQGNDRAANWLENDLRSTLVTMRLLGIGKGS